MTLLLKLSKAFDYQTIKSTKLTLAFLLWSWATWIISFFFRSKTVIIRNVLIVTSAKCRKYPALKVAKWIMFLILSVQYSPTCWMWCVVNIRKPPINVAPWRKYRTLWNRHRKIIDQYCLYWSTCGIRWNEYNFPCWQKFKYFNPKSTQF